MEENLEILIRGEITYLLQNSDFMVLVDDLRDEYKSTPTPDCMKTCVDKLRKYINKYEALVKTDLRLLNTIIAFRRNNIVNNN